MMGSLDTRVLFTVLVAVVALLRVWELRISRRNELALRARGGVEHGAGHYPWMVALHAAFLVACLVEVWLLRRPFVPGLALGAFVVLVLATGLRRWTIATLGGRWTTRVIVLPGAAPVVGGPFRHLRHPNYLAVVLEIAALPLVHTAWATAIVFTLANGLLLRSRIACEERAFDDASGYGRVFAGRRRLVPGRAREGGEPRR